VSRACVWTVIVETALYFPHIRVPETSWFAQILLYWDKAAAIVPYSLSTDESSVGRYMTQLARARLVEFISPDEHLGRYDEAFCANFLALVQTHALMEALEPRRSTRLHAEKMSWALFEQLRQLGLATFGQGPEYEQWWRVEQNTADLYMAYLASAISGVRAGTYPVTDQAAALATLTPPSGDVMARLQDLRYAAITQALPAPSSAVAPEELRRFKDQHQMQLRRLRHHLDGRLADLAMIEHPALRQVKADAVLDEIRDEVAVLRELMERRRWPPILMIGVGGVVGAALGAASGIATAGGTLALGLQVASGAVSMTGTTYQAARIFREPRFNKRAPLAYAALAGKL
jgi:hypothetical protein